jgi:hypothetical protein
MATHPELTGQLGRYRILNSLGAGGMGTVYLAIDTHLDRRVALKVPHFKPDDPPLVIERFQREARIAGRIEHPNLCPVHDVGEIDGIHFFTMPYIEGTTLSRSIDPAHPFQPAQAAELVRKIALAVALLHQNGIVHRDLKPSNIIVRTTGEPVLMDFGLARSFTAQSQRLTSTGTPLGSPSYMAPEQVTGSREFGPATDVYGLGMILFEMVTGQLPFEGPMMALFGQILHTPPRPPSAFRGGIDMRMDAICMKAISKKPEDRHPTMELFAAELAAYVSQPPASVPATPLAPTLATRGDGRPGSPPPAGIRGAMLVGQEEQGPPLAEIICPKCDKTLKVPTTVVGRRVKCPRCQAALGRIGEPNAEQAGRNTAPQASGETVAHGLPHQRAGQAVGRPARQGKQGQQRADFVEPIDEAPTQRKRGGKPARHNPLWAWVILGMLVLLAGAFVFYYLRRPGPGRHFDYVPHASHGFVTVNVPEALKSEPGRKALEKFRKGNAELSKFEQKTGIAVEDVDRMTGVIFQSGSEWTILTTKHAYDRKKVLEYYDTPVEMSHKEKPYHLDKNKFAVHFADAKTLVMASERDMLRCLETVEKNPRGPLQEGVDLALRLETVGVMAFNVAAMDGKETTGTKVSSLLAKPTQGVKIAIASLSAITEVEVAVAVDFVDEQRAAAVLKELPDLIKSGKGLLGMLPARGNEKQSGVDVQLFTKMATGLLDQVNPRQHGARLSCEVSLPSKDVTALIESMQIDDLAGIKPKEIP